MALHRAGIPFNNANFPQAPDTLRGDVVVQDSDFERATQVFAQLLQNWEFDRSTNLGPSYDPREPYWPTEQSTEVGTPKIWNHFSGQART